MNSTSSLMHVVTPKAAFQLRVFLFAQKGLILSKFHTSSDYLNKLKFDNVEEIHFYTSIYSFICLMGKI